MMKGLHLVAAAIFIVGCASSDQKQRQVSQAIAVFDRQFEAEKTQKALSGADNLLRELSESNHGRGNADPSPIRVALVEGKLIEKYIFQRAGLPEKEISEVEFLNALAKSGHGPTVSNEIIGIWIRAHGGKFSEALEAKYLLPNMCNGTKAKSTTSTSNVMTSFAQILNFVLENTDHEKSLAWRYPIHDLTDALAYAFTEIKDEKTIDDLVYWLVYYASLQPEFASADVWSEYRERKWREFRQSLNDTAIPISPAPCFSSQTADDGRWVPLTDEAIYYLLYLDSMERSEFQGFLTRETALFWATALTLKSKSKVGHAMLKQFRVKHAIKPDSDFWLKAYKDLESLFPSNEPKSYNK